MSPIFFSILPFLFAILHGLLAMQTGTIPLGQLVPRPQPPILSNSLVKSSGTVSSNSSNSVSFSNTRKKKGSALKLKAVPGNGNSQKLSEKKENEILTKNDIQINDHKNDKRGKERRILNQFNVGKKKFIIRWAEPMDISLIFGMYYNNNSKHFGPKMPARILGEPSEEEKAKFEAEMKEFKNFQENARKQFEVELSDVGRKHALVADQITTNDGIITERGIVGYLLFEYTPTNIVDVECKIINVVDFFTYPEPENQEKKVVKELFHQLIKLSQEKECEAIEMFLNKNKNENKLLTEEIDKLPGIVKDQHHGSLWQLSKEKFAQIQSEYSDDNGIGVLVNEGEFDPENPDTANLEVQQINLYKIVGNARFQRKPFSSWTSKYIWLQHLEASALFQEDVIVAIFAKLIEIFTQKYQIDGIAWIAGRKMTEDYGKIFENLGATRSYHRWNVHKIVKNGSSEDEPIV